MKLLIDLGNSALKYCTYDGVSLGDTQRLLYKQNALDKLFTEFSEMFNTTSMFSSAWISSVAKQSVTTQLCEQLAIKGMKDINQIQSRASQNGIQNAYAEAEQLGVDRWMALQAMNSLGLSSAIIVSCGTAVTVDVLIEGQHQGGFISAGLGMQLQSLSSTALPRLQSGNINGFSSEIKIVFKLATDTENAVISGTLYSIVSWIDRVVSESCKNNKNNIPRVITGGDAPVLLPYLTEQSWRHEPSLVLQGIATIAGGI